MFRPETNRLRFFFAGMADKYRPRADLAAAVLHSAKEFMKKVFQLLALRPNCTLVLVVLAALVPFLAKPFNMDDPLFVWAARQISAHPGNPYGFEVNWYGAVTPMSAVNKNPPLACYYLAAAAGVLGWSEVALHTAFLLPALAVILGTYRLARLFCERPMLAAFVTLFTPTFLISATTVMCDVLMLAFWVWAVVLWVEGFQQGSLSRFWGAGLLVALAELTKYFGACLVPLLMAYGLIVSRRFGWWTMGLLVPLATLCAYHWTTQSLYGRALLGDVTSYTALPEGVVEMLRTKSGSLLTALAFTGGCLAVVWFFAPLLWPLRKMAFAAAGAVLLAVVLLAGSGLLKGYGPIQGSSRLFIEAQLVFWVIGGASILALAIADVWCRRDASSWLLALWVIGTFLFVACFNWTVNGRTILPMAPAVAILLVRRLERQDVMGGKAWPRGATICLAAGVALALLAARADFMFATAVRESAQQTHSKYAHETAGFWFQGHWGFQYYMDALGASALDASHTVLQRKDLIATPENNTNFAPLGPELVVLREIITVPGQVLLATMKGEVGAGFYASLRGPLPFAFGFVPADRVVVCEVDPVTPPSRPDPANQ